MENITKDKIIKIIIKKGFNKQDAKKWTNKYYNDVVRIYAGQDLTVNKFADIITSFACL